jgi:hypothetical protein
MAILTIPTSTTLAVYRFSIELDGLVYELAMFFNQRDERWYFDLYDEAGSLLRAGLKVTTNFPILRLDQSNDRLPGEMIGVEPSGEDLFAGLEDLGNIVTLTYIEEASLG